MVEDMVNRISTLFIFRLLLVARQAERSVDYLLRNPSQLWGGFHAFYDEHDRKTELQDAQSKLKQLIGTPTPNVWWYPCIQIAPFLSWRPISTTLVSQSSMALGEVIQLLIAEAPPTTEELVRLRKSLHQIQVKLAKSFWKKNRILSAGKKIEHYGQNQYAEFCSIKEVTCSAN